MGELSHLCKTTGNLFFLNPLSGKKIILLVYFLPLKIQNPKFTTGAGVWGLLILIFI